MSDGGKGSKPRPFSVDQKTFSENWNKIFGKKDTQAVCPDCGIDLPNPCDCDTVDIQNHAEKNNT